jgi:predicted O-methyltransferase YrrM
MLNHIQINDAMRQYIRGLCMEEPEAFTRLREETAQMPLAEMQVPVEEGQFLALLLRLMGARRTLEIGVFTGYSTLWTASALPSDGTVVACEINPDYAAIARRFWQEAGVATKIDLRLGPANVTMRELLEDGNDELFDFVFIDADKPNYLEYYELSLSLLRTGGLIAIDNVLRAGQVIDQANRDPGTIAIRRLNQHLKDDERVMSSLVPIADGVTLAIKK